MKYLLMVLVTFVIALGVTPLAIKLAPRIGAVDVPGEARRMHSKTMPRFGGLAMFAAAEAGLGIFLHSDPKVLVIMLGGLLIYLVGAVDDLKGLPPKVKFLLQMVCAAVIFMGGVKIETIKNPISGFSGFTGEMYITFPEPVSFVITVIWIVGLTNTVNLIDGLDGLAAGVSCIASACIAYCAVLSGQLSVGLAMLAVTGATLGFLPYNFHPAKTFMGDSGSLFLGFMIAVISILGSAKGATLIATLVPFLVLGLPIFDTAFAIIRRWVNGCPIMMADRGHIHHRIMNTGIGQRRTVLIMYCISAIMGMIATLVVQRIMVQAAVLAVIAAVLVCVFVADQGSMKEIMKEGLPQEKENKNTAEKKK